MKSEKSEFLIIDAGSGYTKCGFSGESIPRLVFPSIIECEKTTERLVGNDAYETCGVGLTKPILSEMGSYNHWDDFNDHINYCFKEMSLDSKKSNVFLTYIPLQAKNVREHFAQILFEEFDISSLMLEIGQFCSMISTGKETGLVLDMGENFIYTVPIYEFYELPHAIHIIEGVGGKAVRNELSKILLTEVRKELNPVIPLHNEILNDIIMKHSYVTIPSEQTSKNETIRYELPCRNIIELNEHVLTQPIESILKKRVKKNVWWAYGKPDEFELVTASHNSIMRTDIDIRQDLFKNIFLTGGSSKFPGMVERTRMEVMNKFSSQNNNHEVNMRRVENPEFCSFLGASVKATLFAEGKIGYDRGFINAEQYDEYGSSILFRRNF